VTPSSTRQLVTRAQYWARSEVHRKIRCVNKCARLASCGLGAKSGAASHIRVVGAHACEDVLWTR